MLKLVFGYIEEVICTTMIALSLFIAGIVYGDAPIDIKFTCDIPSQVYEYEVGDEVKIDVTAENVGRPFIGAIKVVHAPAIYVKVFMYDEDGKERYIYSNQFGYSEIITDDADVEGYIKRGFKIEEEYHFTIPENAEKGEYSIRVSRFGVEKVFENMITVK